MEDEPFAALGHGHPRGAGQPEPGSDHAQHQPHDPGKHQDVAKEPAPRLIPEQEVTEVTAAVCALQPGGRTAPVAFAPTIERHFVGADVDVDVIPVVVDRLVQLQDQVPP